MDLKDIEAIVGPRGVIAGSDVRERPNEALGKGACPAKAIIRPASTDEVSRVLALCYQHGQSVVPMGGLTGLVNGTTCTSDDIGLSLERMNLVEAVDKLAGTMTVQAGVVLQHVQERAEQEDWKFAVDYGARGSAQIGGAIATNAGGNSVLRYGMMREQVLGLEVVLADGRIVSSMNELLKNNTGYDLKQMFIGSEGTLGIVTRAVLRLRPPTLATQTALLAINDYELVTTLLRRLGTSLDGNLTAFEVMWNNFYALLTQDRRHHQFLPADYPYYVLVEASSAAGSEAVDEFTEILSGLMEESIIASAVIAQSGQQVDQLWALRDDIEGLSQLLETPIPFDVSLPIRDAETYVRDISKLLTEQFPASKLISFGHLGDNNIHIVVGGVSASDYPAVNQIVYGCLLAYGGSVSAEHGIGLAKKSYLEMSRNTSELELMKTLKVALDPKGILNPGKIFS